MNRVRLALAAAAAAVASTASFASAQVGPGQPLSISAANDVVTAYNFRGYEQQDTGFIDQPSLSLFWKAYQTENISVTPFVGSWASLHSHQSGDPGHDLNLFYEVDGFVGVDVAVSHFVLTPVYTVYTYPGSGFRTVQEYGLKVRYDDSKLWGEKCPFSFQPYVAYYSEFNGTNSGASDEGQYAEVGIVPTLTPVKCPFTFTFPIALGMSPDGYYFENDGDNSSLGYFSAGADVSYKIPLNEKWGEWRFHVGVTYLQLLANSTRAADNGSADDWVGRAGITIVY